MSARILGLGIDIVDLSRIAGILDRHGERFVARLCRPGEWQQRRGSGQRHSKWTECICRSPTSRVTLRR